MLPVEDDASEWKTVTKSDRKRISRRGRRKYDDNRRPLSKHHPIRNQDNPDPQDFRRALRKRIEELESSRFFGVLANHIRKNLHQDPIHYNSSSESKHSAATNEVGTTVVDAIVCYGLGNFASLSSPSFLQLACAMAIRNCIKAKQKSSAVEMCYYDPLMTEWEQTILSEESVSVITENEKGSRVVSRTTFFFMPHCPLRLYTNALSANWHHLDRILLFGNSLSSYASRLESNADVELLRSLQSHWKEEVLPVSKEDISNQSGYFEQAFNDSSLTYFAKIPAADLPDLITVDDIPCDEVV